MDFFKNIINRFLYGKSKYLNVKFNGKYYTIEYKISRYVLYFTDKNGASLGFVRRGAKGGLGVYCNDKYKLSLENYVQSIKNEKQRKQTQERLKGTNAYTLAPEQVTLLKNWLNKNY
ncbi:MAG: hypothetical protein ACYCS1_05325 [Gammaproteobacteria bacterium]